MFSFQKYKSKKYSKGDIILHSGDSPNTLFYLKKGFVKRYTESFDGKEVIIHIFDSGAIFPLLWAVEGKNPSFSLAALTDCELALVPAQDYIDHIKNDKDRLFDLTIKLLKGLEGMAKRVEILSTEKADSKVKSTLAYLSRHLGVEFEFTHEELAKISGLTREHVSIEMKKLKNQGVVSYKRNTITIIDIDRLISL